VQIRSAVPEIFPTQTKTQNDSAKNRTFRSWQRTVIKLELFEQVEYSVQP